MARKKNDAVLAARWVTCRFGAGRNRQVAGCPPQSPVSCFRVAVILAAALLLAWGGSLSAGQEKVTTNGLGGGDWSDPATWRGKKVPGAKDDVVIRKGDLVSNT